MGDLSANFSKSEFECHCGCGFNHVSHYLVTALQHLRDDLNEPVHILSGCRCEKHNEKQGGAKNSQHLEGKAADIRITGIKAVSLYAYLNAHADRFGFKGIGLYEKKNFVHVDVRDIKARWNG